MIRFCEYGQVGLDGRLREVFGISPDVLDVLSQLPKDSDLYKMQTEQLMNMYALVLNSLHLGLFSS